MKKIILITIAAIILISATAGFYYMRGYFGPGIKQCPEAWYDNQMPGMSIGGDRQYMIIEGENRQLNEVNVEWIKLNCEVNKPSVVW